MPSPSSGASPGRDVLRRRLESGVEQLPVLPTILTKLLALDRKADDFPENVLSLIELEPGFAARILGAANSAASAPATPIASLRSALLRIGSSRGADLATAAAITRVFIPQDPWEQGIWRHSLQVAVAARSLATQANDRDLPPGEVYAAALLHDVGRLIMFSEAPDVLRAVDEGDWDSPEQLILAERAICGLTHTELGASACRRWNLPPLIVCAARDHHNTPDRGARTLQAKVCGLMRFADLAMFPSAVPGSLGWAEASTELVGKVLVPKLPYFLRMTAVELHAMICSAAAEADLMARVLGVTEVSVRA